MVEAGDGRLLDLDVRPVEAANVSTAVGLHDEKARAAARRSGMGRVRTMRSHLQMDAGFR